MSVQALPWWSDGLLDPTRAAFNGMMRMNFDHLDKIWDVCDIIGFNYYYSQKAGPIAALNLGSHRGPNFTEMGWDIDPAGLPAKTEFRLLRCDPDGTALVEARPLTGRTNQIRANLWHLGYPIVGDPVYLENASLGTSHTLPLSAPSMCLHAHRLAFRHPVENALMRFEAPMPSWAHTEARSHEKEEAAVV